MSLKSKIHEIIILIEEMNELFYQQKNAEGFTNLDQVLVVLMQIINELFQYEFEDNSIERDKIEINNILVKAMKAMELKDTVLIADIFQHELIDKLSKIEEVL